MSRYTREFTKNTQFPIEKNKICAAVDIPEREDFYS